MNYCFVIKTLLLLNIFLVGLTEAALSPEEEQEIINGVMQSCRDKEKASDADMEILQRLGIPESREGKCVLACALETVGIVSELLKYCELEIQKSSNNQNLLSSLLL